MINQYECGIAVPPDSPEAFADALERLADSPELRQQMGRNARRLAEQRFDRRTLAAQFADFLEEFGQSQVSGAASAGTVPCETTKKAA
jgi:glycosyltransferase involved in cell wall biosynthesis